MTALTQAATPTMGYLDRTRDWSDREVIDWLRKGFALQHSGGPPSARRFAFDPLEISLEQEPFGQLAGAILEGDNPGLPAAAHVERAIISYLTVRETISHEDVTFASDLWMLLSGLNLKPAVAGVGRQFLSRAKSLRQKQMDRLVRSVGSAVASIQPVTNMQITFFEHLRMSFPRIWASDLTVLVVELGFAKAADDRAARAKGAFAPAEAWKAISTRWQSEIVETLQQGGLRANILASTVARHLELVGRQGTPEALMLAVNETAEPGASTICFESFQPLEAVYA